MLFDWDWNKRILIKYNRSDTIFGVQSWRRGTSVRLVRVRLLLDKMKYLIFSFLRSGIEARRGVYFHHSTQNASRIRRQQVVKCLNTWVPLLTLLHAGYSVKLKKKDTIFGSGTKIIVMFSLSYDLEQLWVDRSGDSIEIYAWFKHHLAFRNRQNKFSYFIDITTSTSVEERVYRIHLAMLPRIELLNEGALFWNTEIRCSRKLVKGLCLHNVLLCLFE